MSQIDELIAKLEEAQRLASEIKSGESTKIPEGANLQAALDMGGNLVTEPNAVFAAERFVFSKPVHLTGPCKLIGTAGPAIYVPPGANGIYINNVECSATYHEAIQLGNNDKEQTKLEQVPKNIELNQVHVLSHNGKRGIAINSTLTRIINCDLLDVWDRGPAHADSHPWAIMNTPGEVFIQGGLHSGGSELGLIGGDTMKIPGVKPSNIFIGGTPEQNLILFRPLGWMEDGIHRAVKCGFEAKTCDNLFMRYVTIRGNWKFAQPDAFAIQLTPSSGGSITNASFEDIIVEDSPSFCGITAFDPTGNPTRTTGIKMNRIKITLNKTKFLGGGRVFLLQGNSLMKQGIGTLDVSELDIVNPGGNTILYSDKQMIERISFMNSKANLGSYSIMLGGEAHGNVWQQYVYDMIVKGNTFSQANAAFKTRFPDNTYV